MRHLLFVQRGQEPYIRPENTGKAAQILSKDNLNDAYLQAAMSKGAEGVAGMTVEELGAYISENAEKQ